MFQALESVGDFQRAYGADISDHLELLRGVVKQTLAFQARFGAVPPWIGYAVVRDGRQVVGSCGFQGNPNDAGWVEIAYFTFPAFERQGLATAMAKLLVAMAGQSPVVRRVLAHTLPEPNASTRVLEKAGFAFVGEVIDPEDGRVWQWAFTL